MHLLDLVGSFFFHTQFLSKIWLEIGSDKFKLEEECLIVRVRELVVCFSTSHSPPSFLSPIFCEDVVQPQENKPRLSEDEPISELEDFRPTLSWSPDPSSLSWPLPLLFFQDHMA